MSSPLVPKQTGTSGASGATEASGAAGMNGTNRTSGAGATTGATTGATAGATGTAEEAVMQARDRTVHDYKGRIKPIWCPGCGNYSALGAMLRTFVALDIEPENLAVVSGIGCSSRIPGFIQCYGYHGVHGRALPSAVGVKLGNPRLTVLAVGGDGDGLSIGMGHFPHAARRNIDITYVLLDNRIYGLTKGQTSPTTCQGWWTKTSPQGVVETPLNPIELGIVFGASFVARGYSGAPNGLDPILKAAIEHKGFSLVHIISPCVTFGKGSGYKFFGPLVKELPAEHDPKNRAQALAAATHPETIYTGVFLHDAERKEYASSVQEGGGARGREVDPNPPRIDAEALIDRFS